MGDRKRRGGSSRKKKGNAEAAGSKQHRNPNSLKEAAGTKQREPSSGQCRREERGPKAKRGPSRLRTRPGDSTRVVVGAEVAGRSGWDSSLRHCNPAGEFYQVSRECL